MQIQANYELGIYSNPDLFGSSDASKQGIHVDETRRRFEAQASLQIKRCFPDANVEIKLIKDGDAWLTTVDGMNFKQSDAAHEVDAIICDLLDSPEEWLTKAAVRA
ncbi:MAG: hypothetical protein WCG34_08905 [Leptolinea sp.]